MKWTKQSEVEWGEVKCSRGKGDEGRVFMEKVYSSSKWWEVKDWGESMSELNDWKKKKQLQETVHSTLLLGCFYHLYMYSNLCRVFCC